MTYVPLLLLFLLIVSPSMGQNAAVENSDFSWSKDSLLIDQLFERYQGERPGAAFMVIKDGDVVAKKAYGYADLKNRIKTSLHSNFRLASATKQFTAMAILQLIQQQKLRLNTSLKDIFEDFPSYGSTITVQHLLRHRSGLVDYMDLMAADRSSQILDAEILELMKAQDSTLFVPGSKCLYSNSAYAVLAMVIEKISGQSFAEFMQKEIFEPLGMMQTSVYQKDQEIKHRAYGYSQIGRVFRMTDQSTTSAVQGDGGIYSSVIDYQKWDDALYTNQLVPMAVIEKSLIPQDDLLDYRYQQYGDGWRCDYIRGIKITHHSGHTKGFTNYTLRIPALKIAVIVLSNRNNEDAAIYIGNTLAALFSDGRLPVYDRAWIDAVYHKEGAEKVLEAYRSLALKSPIFESSENTLLFLGKKLQKAQQFDWARLVYLEQIKVFPHSFESYYQLARCYAALGQDKEAALMQQYALDRVPATYQKIMRAVLQKSQ